MKQERNDFWVKKWKVEESNKRIDTYLVCKNSGISRATIQRLIEQGKILVNGKKVKASYQIQNGDEIVQEEEEIQLSSIKPQNIPLQVLYEDKDIIVVNKPKGMVVHPAAR